MMMNATCWQCNRFPFSSLNVVRTESLHPAMIFGSPFLSLSLSLSAGTCIISTYRFQLPPQNCVISINYVFLSLPPSGAAFDWSTFSRYFLNYLFIDRYDDVAVGRSMDRYRYFHSRFFLPSFLPYFPSWSFVPLRPKFSFPSFSHPHAKCGRRTSQDGSPRRQTNHHNRPSQRGDTAAVEAGRVGRRRRRHWRPRQNGHECVKRRGRRRRS